jgi:hypothetical protein
MMQRRHFVQLVNEMEVIESTNRSALAGLRASDLVVDRGRESVTRNNQWEVDDSFFVLAKRR